MLLRLEIVVESKARGDNCHRSRYIESRRYIFILGRCVDRCGVDESSVIYCLGFSRTDHYPILTTRMGRKEDRRKAGGNKQLVRS